MTLIPGPPSAEGSRDLYLNIGCGLVAPLSWTNIDASWNARLARVPGIRPLLAALRLIPSEIARIPWPRNIIYHDVRRGLPYPDCVIAGVYSSHMIEHLRRDDGRRFIQECYRVLRPGGVIRLVTPDLAYLATRYVAAKDSGASPTDQPAHRLLMDSGLIQDFTGTFRLTRLYRLLVSYDLHKWLYDERSLEALLLEAGFSGIGRRAYLESQIPWIKDVETEDRVKNNLCLEGFKG